MVIAWTAVSNKKIPAFWDVMPFSLVKFTISGTCYLNLQGRRVHSSAQKMEVAHAFNTLVNPIITALRTSNLSSSQISLNEAAQLNTKKMLSHVKQLKYGVWIDNQIYWTLITCNCKHI
jgi:hypothetical protein